MNIKPEERGSEIMPTEPYLLGSHSGCCGIWVSGPNEDWVPEEYKIKADNGKVYNRMTTVNGLWTCADGVGASGHKFSSGSHAEGRIVRQADGALGCRSQGFKPTLKRFGRRSEERNLPALVHLRAVQGCSTDPVSQPELHQPQQLHDAPHQVHR
jgi:adenylylsulfate reductase, subunit A